MKRGFSKYAEQQKTTMMMLTKREVLFYLRNVSLP